MGARRVPCAGCGRALQNDEIALGIKMRGLACAKPLCFSCSAIETGATEEELRELAQWFRQSGCAHFQRDYLA